VQKTAVIMAGGKGERFWPKSRTNLPKQFLNISGNESMLQLTIKRLEKLIPVSQIFIVTNELYAELIKAQILKLPYDNIIIEPVGRNTAPCIGLASIVIEERFPGSTMVVLPSDHIIKDEAGFLQILNTAFDVAASGPHLVTLGIRPTYPETGYGYIERTDEVRLVNGMEVYKVNQFVEKPSVEKARAYLEAGNFYWNSGIFVWQVQVIRDYIRTLMPDMHEVLETIKAGFRTGDWREAIRREFHRMPDESIDYGIMEKVRDIHVIPCVFGWDDVGSWTALERINELDENGNVIRGNILNLDTKRCIIESSGGKLIATLGIEDLIIIDTEDVTLICAKDKAQEIKLLLKELRQQKMDQYL